MLRQLFRRFFEEAAGVVERAWADLLRPLAGPWWNVGPCIQVADAGHAIDRSAGDRGPAAEVARNVPREQYWLDCRVATLWSVHALSREPVLSLGDAFCIAVRYYGSCGIVPAVEGGLAGQRQIGGWRQGIVAGCHWQAESRRAYVAHHTRRDGFVSRAVRTKKGRRHRGFSGPRDPAWSGSAGPKAGQVWLSG